MKLAWRKYSWNNIMYPTSWATSLCMAMLQARFNFSNILSTDIKNAVNISSAIADWLDNTPTKKWIFYYQQVHKLRNEISL